MVTTDLTPPVLSGPQFEAIRRLIHEVCGINLQAGKEALVRSRLSKRLRALGLADFDAYLARVREDRTGAELSELVNALTTNKTSFFREPEHFEYLREVIVPELEGRRGPIRVWSAGCSSGEEAYSLAIVLREALTDAAWREVRILATDISTRVLAKARDGVYAEGEVRVIPRAWLARYFEKVQRDGQTAYAVRAELRSAVRVARLNLMEPWPMKGPFDLIVCRNVMIYFDRPTQQRLVQRFWEMLAPGGHLFVGHSESLTSLGHSFRYVRPATYVKPRRDR